MKDEKEQRGTLESGVRREERGRRKREMGSQIDHEEEAEGRNR